MILVCLLVFQAIQTHQHEGSCPANKQDICVQQHAKYLLYKVQNGEGFNLQRDVFMRMAQVVLFGRAVGEDRTLVLPEWTFLPHWTVHEDSHALPWSTFFDVQSMKQVTPLIEFKEFLETEGPSIDLVIHLSFFEETLDDETDFFEHHEMKNCSNSELENEGFFKQEDGSYFIGFWSHMNDLRARRVKCMNFEGTSERFTRITSSPEFGDYRSILVSRAEIVLHQNYGSAQFWKIRRSMTFNHNLISIANEFVSKIREAGQSFEIKTEDALLEMTSQFVGVHLRRGDFARYRVNDVPSIECAVDQIIAVLEGNHMKRLFVSSDASQEEMDSLLLFLKHRSPSTLVFSFRSQVSEELHDGEKAIIDQLVCSQSDIFIGKSSYNEMVSH